MNKHICSITNKECKKIFPPLDIDVYPCDNCEINLSNEKSIIKLDMKYLD